VVARDASKSPAALQAACGVQKLGARPEKARFAGRTLILAPHTAQRAAGIEPLRRIYDLRHTF
jgi:hypothetical protein